MSRFVRRTWHRLAVLGALLCSPICSAGAQTITVGDALEQYARVMQISGKLPAGSFAVRPMRAARLMGFTEPHPWQHIVTGRPAQGLLSHSHYSVDIFDPAVETHYNSARPWGRNDGALWQGVGTTTRLTAGAFARYRWFSAAFRPTFSYTANGDFELSRLPINPRQTPYNYPGRNDIDMPQRFGDEPFGQYTFGESYVRAAYRGIAAGVSNQTMWWGPGVRNAIIVSNNAGGFRHVFLGTDRALRTIVGSFEANWIWGSLWHSDYFVDASYSPDRRIRGSEVNRRYLTGLAVSYEPRWIPGLYVGALQTYMLHAAVPRYFEDLFAVVNLPFFNDTDRHGGGTDDKLVSLFARWVLPESGFEVYGEWARGDHTSTFRDFFVAPHHGRGFTVGAQKSYELPNQYMTLLGSEITNLEATREFGSRDRTQDGISYFYTHDGIKQGFTHLGQVIGAGIGPAAQMQSVWFDVFGPWGKAGLLAYRWVPDGDRYYLFRENHYEREVELALGLNALYFLERFEIGGSITYGRLLNRDYVFKNDETNINVAISVRYRWMGLR